MYTQGLTALGALTGPKAAFVPVRASLRDVLGAEYTGAVRRAAGVLGADAEGVGRLLARKVDFFPKELQRAQAALLDRVGFAVIRPMRRSAKGATTAKFADATHTERAPVGAMGMYRIGEDGELYLITKSEHYHTPLGHGFPGYRLLDHARAAGIVSATHNNTRGHITRLLEEELVRTANGISAFDDDGLRQEITWGRPMTLNRVLNLETGSLAAEAAIKLVLARFYSIQTDSPMPVYCHRVPVLLVVGDEHGGLLANYHGTTIIAQMMRGMWAGLRLACATAQALEVRAVPHNDIAALEQVFRQAEHRPYKIAGFFHELVLMNHGAVPLDTAFIRRAYALCRQHDVPTVVDEIQTGLWSPKLYLFREYGLKPSIVVLGKGFPGGEYPASRVLFTASLDSLPQFGALVTNGQEELASLAYLITMRWAQANAEVTRAIGDYYEQRVRELADQHRDHVQAVHGRRHLLAVHFHDLEQAEAFVHLLQARGLDISAQTYKLDCPPAALTKLPLIASLEVVDFIVDQMRQALSQLGQTPRPRR